MEEAASPLPVSNENMVIYCIYVRNHGPHGTFKDVEADLPRISNMGVSMVWFLPMYPIGQLKKKGSLGSPYSIRDYSGINTEHGTLQDFKDVVTKCHSLGMRVMIDIVFNHTSHDSVFIKDHPEWYHRDENGIPARTVNKWTDIIDLKFSDNPKLWESLCNVLMYWVGLGVDGFRCDVAPLVPLAFWKQAREAVSAINPNVVWLAETGTLKIIEKLRKEGKKPQTDGEMYQVFDITYDYDICPIWQSVVSGNDPVERYLEMLRIQDCIYPANYLKLRFVENHDRSRIMQIAKSRNAAIAWTAFMAFNKGPFLIYAGQEAENKKAPSLFDIDKVSWESLSLQPLLASLASIKKRATGLFIPLGGSPALTACWESTSQECFFGIFNVSDVSGSMKVPLASGTYEDLLSGTKCKVANQKIDIPSTAVILLYKTPLRKKPHFSSFVDFTHSVYS